jgi:hypothetical protein
VAGKESTDFAHRNRQILGGTVLRVLRKMYRDQQKNNSILNKRRTIRGNSIFDIDGGLIARKPIFKI